MVQGEQADLSIIAIQLTSFFSRADLNLLGVILRNLSCTNELAFVVKLHFLAST